MIWHEQQPYHFTAGIWKKDWKLISPSWGRRYAKKHLSMRLWRINDEPRWYWDYKPSDNNARNLLDIVETVQDGRWKIE